MRARMSVNGAEGGAGRRTSSEDVVSLWVCRQAGERRGELGSRGVSHVHQLVGKSVGSDPPESNSRGGNAVVGGLSLATSQSQAVRPACTGIPPRNAERGLASCLCRKARIGFPSKSQMKTGSGEAQVLRKEETGMKRTGWGFLTISTNIFHNIHNRCYPYPTKSGMKECGREGEGRCWG